MNYEDNFAFVFTTLLSTNVLKTVKKTIRVIHFWELKGYTEVQQTKLTPLLIIHFSLTVRDDLDPNGIMPNYTDDCRQYLVNKDHGLFSGLCIREQIKIYQYYALNS